MLSKRWKSFSVGPKLFTEMVEIYIKDANRCKCTFLCKHSPCAIWCGRKTRPAWNTFSPMPTLCQPCGLILVGKVRMWASRRDTVVYSRPGWNRGLQHYNTRRRKSLWEFRNARNPGFWRRARELQTDGKIHWWWTERNKNFLKCFYLLLRQHSIFIHPGSTQWEAVGQIWSNVNAQSVKSDLKRPRQFVQQC